ncbi:creatininase family protein [Bradyrhizobium sp.]|uniref:creatininase family protein n=1 Tax=Bradyrhizobium sp. TaxID=376 RepID=UPI002D60312A|nr:creatininase family protein [Bradyrhizobium sp.]HZR76944.1 creatininase family protein [Bradyrhizobium sp.]
MTSTLPPRDYADIGRPEAAGIDRARWIAVLPLAATEQHGPHLPFETDVLIAEAYLARVRELVADVLPVTFLPIERIGISSEHTDFPGTLTLAPEVAIQSWMTIGKAVAKAGIRKLVIVTSHGGNSAAMSLVAQELRTHDKMLAVTTSWGRLSAPETLFPPEEIEHGIHGGAVETSIMLARHGERVRRDAIANFRPITVAMKKDFRWLSAQRPAPFAWQTQDLHPSGAVGDATQATAEKGERLIDQGARAFCELLAEVDHFDLQLLSNRPKT